MIGPVIQRLRMERNLSLSELAERAGISKSYLSSIERDIQGNPSIQILEKICHVLGVSLPELLNAESQMEQEMASLDPDWLEIVKEAQESGIDKEQFREFLEFQIWKNRRGES
ncbi:MAG: helix-turn-helix domain-containing protein [Alicyclobacillus sp.]|nr:helix-turn-helix domain-containing protein [Alicyclobacillus sp.]